MSIQVKGIIERKQLGAGVWALVTSDGNTYELKSLPPELRKGGQTVSIQGKIREDVMTMAMIGPVLEVQSFQIISEG